MMQVLSLERTAMVGAGSQLAWAGSQLTWEIAAPWVEGVTGLVIVSTALFEDRITVEKIFGLLGVLMVADAAMKAGVLADRNTK